MRVSALHVRDVFSKIYYERGSSSMTIKKNMAIIAAALSAAMMTNALLPCAASAAGTRTKEEAYGDSTYAERFMSLYDDVITNGQENGYLSTANTASGGYGIPYHSVETVICEAPDYGHETTSEAMSYIVWVAAMRDKIASESFGEGTGELTKAWKTLEAMIPTTQTGFWSTSSLSAQVAEEDWENVESYPVSQNSSNTGSNPLHQYFISAYSSDKGEYLMHWLADVDDWYGYGGSYDSSTDSVSYDGPFTFINTFQRGNQESCFETIPHPCIEMLKYGEVDKRGMSGAFSQDAQVAKQWKYTNAPDAENRAIQAVYAANRWGVGVSSISTLAGKMGDQVRNDMYDKYYKAIGCQNIWQSSSGKDGCHYLMSWYTAWGGASDGAWAWQIGCSHSHQFYQSPLAAFALLYDSDLNSAMKATDATKDYVTSLQYQLEFYLWLQSANGPFAGGCTNSWNGKYETYPSGVPTFYNMAYVEHPVYADPGSNHWIGNQVWSTQRLAELYYIVCTDTAAASASASVKPGGMSIEAALELMLDKWVAWFIENTELTEDGDYAIPASLDWSGTPGTNWTGGTYDESANSGLTCTITAMGSSDLGCVTSLANTLIWYAAAKGSTAETVMAMEDISDSSEQGDQSLYLARQLLDRVWNLGRDDIGLSRTEYNGSLTRMFSQEIWVPTGYTATTPYGDTITNGETTFISMRSMYWEEEMINTLYDAWVADGSPTYEQVQSGAKVGTGEVALTYHRFWHAGDILMALGTMATLYPDMEVSSEETSDPVWGDANVDGSTKMNDIILLTKVTNDAASLTSQGKINSNVILEGDENVTAADSSKILTYLSGQISYEELSPYYEG